MEVVFNKKEFAKAVEKWMNKFNYTYRNAAFQTKLNRTTFTRIKKLENIDARALYVLLIFLEMDMNYTLRDFIVINPD